MKIAVIVVVVVLAIILFRLISSPSKSKKRARHCCQKAKGRPGHRYGVAEATEQRFRSVSVKCGPQACDTALAWAIDASSRDSSSFPGGLRLSRCGLFEHHADRRESGEDKRAPSALSSELYTASNPSATARRSQRKTFQMISCEFGRQATALLLHQTRLELCCKRRPLR